jgi:hypothetical protein
LQKIARSFSSEMHHRNFICRTPTNGGNCGSRVAPPEYRPVGSNENHAQKT